MASDVFKAHAPRVCRIRSEHAAAEDLVSLDTETFRTGEEEVAVSAEQLGEGVLAFPSMVAEAGAMVVLGEPGAGKTSVLRHLTDELPRIGDTWDGGTDACLWVAGGDLTENSYGEELGYHLDALPWQGETARRAGVLWVVVDQADQSPLLSYLPRRLQRSLQGRDTSRVRFLLACRAADYPARMTPVLSEIFGACWCVDLAPLSREEAVALADSADVPGQELVAAAEAAGAAALASVPLTLELLVLTYQEGHRLQDTPKDLFAQGVERLAEGPELHHGSGETLTTTQQRLTIAGRIAVCVLLSGHRTVWRGRVSESGTFDLPEGVLAGGTERSAAGLYEVTAPMVKETLTTALFMVPDSNRVEFRHSSVAAYLAARYLTERETTQRQLENLFLVGAPDGDTASIPAPLRETAAWLVAMNPAATDWLAAADPESLAVHSALVRSDEFRQLTVSRLLERAAQVGLGGIRWQHSRWALHHPQLADQLAEVLETAPNEGAADWQTTARIRLAIELAQDAGTAHPRLADALLRLVENDAWHHLERRLAARAGFACDPERAVPVLTRILASLNDPSYAARIDPDHHLRGTVLMLLWPDHTDLATVLDALRPPAPHVYNSYAQFLMSMPAQCAEEDLPDLLTWIQTVIFHSDRSTGFSFSSYRREKSLIESVVDRALTSPDVAEHVGTLAKIILSLFRDHHQICLPDCLQPDEQGQEPPSVRSLRRLLGHALVSEAARAGIAPRGASWQIVYHWERRLRVRWDTLSPSEASIRDHLMDGADFAWALEQTARAATVGDDALVATYGELASLLFPREDREAFELAYDTEHPAWPYLRSIYEPITLDSRLAQSLRENHQGRQSHWPQAAEFRTQQAQLLTQAREGDNDSLWRFLWCLSFDPQTGHRGEDLSGPIHDWPGAAALDDALSDLPKLAVRYLTAEHDHADSWLGHSLQNKRSWVGYALLSELHRTNRLSELPPSVWGSWAAALLTEFLGRSTSYSETSRQELLHRAAGHAPQSLARRIIQLVSAALTKGREPIELNPVDPRWAAELRIAMEYLATEISACLGLTSVADNAGFDIWEAQGCSLSLPDSDEAHEAALKTWHSLLGSLLAAGSTTVKEIIDIALSGPPETPMAAQLAVLAAEALLAADAEAHWPRVKAFTAADTELSRRLAEACVRTEISQRMQSSLSEAGVADLYVWLSDLYPPDEDQRMVGVPWVSPEEEARSWRDHLLGELSQRATAEAVHQLRQLTGHYPDRVAIAASHAAATKHHAAANWAQASVKHVLQVLQEPVRRVIRTSTDLLEVVHEVLEGIDRDLPSHGELLWDRLPGRRPRQRSTTDADDQAVPDRWRPKLEAALCAYLAHELILRLAGHRVAVNREVMIRPTDPYGAGDRTDILIDALPPPGDHPDTPAGSPVKLVIEVKGAWNDKLPTAQEEQLADRYLPEATTDAGIYLVGWYPLDLWNDEGDYRRRKAVSLDPDTLLADLQDQAERLARRKLVHLRPMILTAPRPHSQ